MALEIHKYVLENRDTDSTEDDNHEIDAEVHHEVELISALEEIDGLKEKNRNHKNELQKYEEEEHDLEETEKTIIILKAQLE
jgi:hypothetical protein